MSGHHDRREPGLVPARWRRGFTLIELLSILQKRASKASTEQLASLVTQVLLLYRNEHSRVRALSWLYRQEASTTI